MALQRLKYRRRPALARALGELLYKALLDRQLERSRFQFGLIVPVPLHPRRLVERGFNQACLLAISLNRHLALPLDAHSLRRSHPTRTQTQLRIADRTQNVHHAFLVRPHHQIDDNHVLLVDDVSTTGATLAACVQVLSKAGARSVTTLVVAQAQQRIARANGLSAASS